LEVFLKRIQIEILGLDKIDVISTLREILYKIDNDIPNDTQSFEDGSKYAFWYAESLSPVLWDESEEEGLK
jgi:hypothetical protein